MVDIEEINSIKKDVFKNKSETNMNKSNLMDFISNSHKFHFNSAFDHKGAKSFLKEKEKALKKIIIDDNMSDEQSIESNKKKHKFLNLPNMDSNENKQIYLSGYNDNKSMKSTKDINHKKEKCKSVNGNEDNKKDKHLKITQKSTQFFSQTELKMFKDKEIKKLKPIKIKEFKSDKKFNNAHKKQKSYQKIEYRPSDSTLITLIHDMSN